GIAKDSHYASKQQGIAKAVIKLKHIA
ncbi:hypothetical protein CCACVL1_01817, partial [Corchorus capsularis]